MFRTKTDAVYVDFFVKSLAQVTGSSPYELSGAQFEDLETAYRYIDHRAQGYMGWADDGFIHSLNFRVRLGKASTIVRYLFSDETRSFHKITED